MKSKLPRFVILLLVAGNCRSLLAQNLIANPGFENDLTNWSTLWTRDTCVGSAASISGLAHSGAKAVQIQYCGNLDWSFEPQSSIPVKSGQVYEYSIWVRIDSLVQDADVQISVVLLDSSHTALNWSYAACACTLSAGNYRYYSSRFLIGPGIRSIEPRIIGDKKCLLYADDFSLTLVDSGFAGSNHPRNLRNNLINVTIDPLFFSFDLQSSSSLTTWSTQGVGLFQTTGIDSFADSLIFHCTYVAAGWPVDIKVWLEGPAMGITLRADSTRPMSSELAFPGPIASGAGDYLLIPKGTGVICPAINAPSYMSHYYSIGFYEWQTDLAMVGVTDLTKGYIITVDDPWFTRVDFSTIGASSARAPQLLLEPAKGFFAKSRTLYYTIADTGGYASLCAWYRSHAEMQGIVMTLDRKAATIPAVALLQGAVDFWVLAKGLSSTDTSFFRNLIDAGIDRAIFSGNISNSLIDSLNVWGMLTSTYDCYCDAYPPGNPGYASDGYGADAIVNQDGSIMNGWLAYLGNGGTLQAQEVCSMEHIKYALPRVTKDRQTRHLNCRFIDVEQAMSLAECWSPEHPVNRCTDAFWRKKLFDTLRTSFSLVLGGEQARDFIFPFVDYGEGTMSLSPAVNSGYDWSTPVAPDTDYVHFNVNPAVHVPLHGLIYHDVHIPTWYTGDGISKVPAFWDDKDLLNILYASMPLFMPPDTGYWRTNFERFLTSYHLVTGVTRSVGFARMTGHRFLTPDWKVQQTTFDNGWTVTVNFDSTASYTLGNQTLAPRGFYAASGGESAYRLLDKTTTIAAVSLADRLFLNTYGALVPVNGLKSSGAVYLKKNDGWAHLGFLGGQPFVDIYPLQLPWKLTGMRVFTEDRSQEITPIIQPDSAQRINRLPGVNYYRIEGTFALKTELMPKMASRHLSLTVTAGGHGLDIRFSHQGTAKVTIDIFDVRGRMLATLLNEIVPGGDFRRNVAIPFSKGIYFVRYRSEATTLVSHAIVIAN